MIQKASYVLTLLAFLVPILTSFFKKLLIPAMVGEILCGIIIGKSGSKLKQIGSRSRAQIERLLGAKVYLKLFVKIQKNWRKDTRAIRRFGY